MNGAGSRRRDDAAAACRQKGAGHGRYAVCDPRAFGHQGVAPVPRRHELRQGVRPISISGPSGPTTRAPSSSGRSTSAINFIDTGEHLRLRHERGVHRRRPARARRTARSGGAGEQGLLQRGASEPRGHQPRDRRHPEAPWNRLPRPLHHPPLRLRHAHRGDHGGARRPGARRQGPRARRKRDVRLPAPQHAGGCRAERLDHVHEHAVPLQPALPARTSAR